MNTSYDIVIVGGGVIGSAVAFFLADDPDFRGRIAVVEKDPSYAAASSSLSTSSIRQQFGTRANIEASKASMSFLRDVKRRLSVEGYPAEIGLREQGYLFLGGEADVPAFMTKNAAQRSCGFHADIMDRGQLGQRFPWLNLEDVTIGSFGPTGEGWFDGPGLHQAFRRKARALGVTYIAGEVGGFEANGMGISHAILLDGTRLAAGTFVNAAGPRAGLVAALAGIPLPVVPRKRCVFVFDSPTKMPQAPFLMDPSGVFVRPEGHLYICGVTPPAENDPGDFGLDVDYALFDDLIWPAIAHRVPGFEQLRMQRAWAGLYEYNTFDHNAIIGPHPALSNFFFANGFSGHGMMHAPAVGMGIAELVIHGTYQTTDLSAFSFDRIARNEPIDEHVY